MAFFVLCPYCAPAAEKALFWGCVHVARPGLNPAAGLLVPVVAVPAVVALVVLFFVRGPVPGSVRRAVPGPAAGRRRCAPVGCRPCGLLPGWSCPSVRSLAPWLGWSPSKSRAGRVIRGRGGSTWRRACCPPGRADLGPGCFAWCRIAGGVAGVRLVRAG